MPELPEVETIRRALSDGRDASPSLIGWTIRSANVLWARSLADSGEEAFLAGVQGETIHAIGRRAKFLRFDLTRHTLLVHLRMSGDLWIEDPSTPLHPHHRIALILENEKYPAPVRLAFNDPRKFGRLWFTDNPAEVLGDLGPEPLEDTFTSGMLQEKLRTYRRQIKPLLMDQHFLAGLGNIYTDEALHQARLHPLTLSDSLSEAQGEALHDAIQAVLLEGIRRNGASIDWVYRGGDFQNYFRVYQRKEEACQTCGTPIQRILVGQRSSYFCPRCQPEPSQTPTSLAHHSKKKGYETPLSQRDTQ